MKKYLLGFIAVVMAVSFSAFTTSSHQTKTQDLWYKDGADFIPFTGTPCPADNVVQCQVNIPNVGTRPLFTQPNDLSPYNTRP